MRLPKITLVVLVIILLLSVFVAKISNVLTVDVNGLKNEAQVDESLRLERNNGSKSDGADIVMKDTQDHLMWFIQITDIHISKYHDPTRITQFREFCSVNLKTIRPAVVIASGDLTDAKAKDNIGSTQHVQEWEYYKEALETCQVTDQTIWLDIRGNHDNFNVLTLSSPENYFRTYSIQGIRHPRSYSYLLKHKGDSYSFIAMDACLEPGPRRPFNFIGMLSASETAALEALERESRGANFSIWFGHYPTSAILAPPPGVRQIMRSAHVYLCGHYHTLGGTVPAMYALHHTGLLELELGDWKDNRLYRVAAVDHGIFSFVDVPHGQWPVILITNPKHALFVLPTKEPFFRAKFSTHIRVLVFSPHHIEKVKVRINEEEWQECNRVDGPLYVAPWVPQAYAHGLHDIEVSVTDGSGDIHSITQPFSLDGTQLSFRFLPRLLLMTNVTIFFQTMFGVVIVLCVVPLCILRIMHKLVKARKLRRPRCPGNFFHCWLRKFWLLATVDRIFYPLAVYDLYLAIGPWAIGEVIEGHVGVIFPWGIIVGGNYLPGSFTYAYGFWQVLMFNLPLTFFLAHCVDCRFRSFQKPKACSLLRYVFRHIPFIFLLATQMMYAYFFWLAYGTLAFILGPFRTWSMILAVVLWYQALTLNKGALRNASLVWSVHQGAPSVEEEYECTSPLTGHKGGKEIVGESLNIPTENAGQATPT